VWPEGFPAVPATDSVAVASRRPDNQQPRGSTLKIGRVSLVTLLAPLTFFGFAATFFVGMNRENPDNLPSTMIGRPAPPLELTPLGDFPLLTAEILRTPEVKLLNFWASWCVGCRLEHPVLVKMAQAGGKIYGVDYKDDKGLSYLTEKENPYVMVSQDEKGRTAIEWGVYGIPETFVIDAKGIVRHRHIGAITEKVMQEIIMPAMAEAAEPELSG
jgi:cytochrome c biogenesis protein CcmG, thiol:disulfide interchange protein DsbE